MRSQSRSTLCCWTGPKFRICCTSHLHFQGLQAHALIVLCLLLILSALICFLILLECSNIFFWTSLPSFLMKEGEKEGIGITGITLVFVAYLVSCSGVNVSYLFPQTMLFWQSMSVLMLNHRLKCLDYIPFQYLDHTCLLCYILTKFPYMLYIMNSAWDS